MEAVGVKDREYFRSEYLKAAINEGHVEMTRPDNPKSPNQKYRLTQQGQRCLERFARD